MFRVSHGDENKYTKISMGWNKIVQDSHRNVAQFDFHGAPVAAKICFQTVEGCLL